MAILAICCLWIVTDVAYGVRMWELGVDAWIGRIKALAIILIGVSLSYLFFNYLVNTFLDRIQGIKQEMGMVLHLQQL